MPEATSFPSFEIEGHCFSKMLLGHNPFIGGSYMSQARSRLYRETLSDPEPVTRIICAAIDAGVRGMMMGVQSEKDNHIIAAHGLAAARTGVPPP